MSMSDSTHKTIKLGVVASLIATGIVAIIEPLRAYAIKLFSWAWSGIVWLWGAIFDSYSAPGWLWGLVVFLSLVGAINIYLFFRKEEELPDFLNYTEDYLYGVKWRWRWIENRISNIWCYCPRCDAELVYDDSSCHRPYLNENKTDFLCENCNQKVMASVNGGNKSYATSAAEREVLRRIRTDEYKKR